MEYYVACFLLIAIAFYVGLQLFNKISDFLHGRVRAEPITTEAIREPATLVKADDPPPFQYGLGSDIEGVIRDLLDIQAKAPTSKNAIGAYVQTLRERARVRSQMKTVELFEKQLTQIERILTSTTSIQSKSIELEKLFIDRKYVPEIHLEERKRQLKEAKEGKPQPPTQPPPQEGTRKVTIDGTELGEINDDETIKATKRS